MNCCCCIIHWCPKKQESPVRNTGYNNWTQYSNLLGNTPQNTGVLGDASCNTRPQTMVKNTDLNDGPEDNDTKSTASDEIEVKTSNHIDATTSMSPERTKNKPVSISSKKREVGRGDMVLAWMSLYPNTFIDTCKLCKTSEMKLYRTKSWEFVTIDGDSLEISNLRPICTDCMNKMGNSSLMEYCTKEQLRDLHIE